MTEKAKARLGQRRLRKRRRSQTVGRTRRRWMWRVKMLRSR